MSQLRPNAGVIVERALGRARLWLSYQRYTLLLGVGCPALVALLAYAWPDAWWLWGPAALASLPAVRFAWTIHRRLRWKMAVTKRARRHIERGTFEPESLQVYCTDPCSRVMVAEILSLAGMPAQERRALLKELSRKEKEEGGMLVFVDRASGVVHTYERGQVKTDQIRGSESSESESNCSNCSPGGQQWQLS